MTTCISARRRLPAADPSPAVAADAIEIEGGAAAGDQRAAAADGGELRIVQRRRGRSQQANVAPAGSGLLEDWSVDSALAYYHEDGRIHAIEPVVDLAKVYADGKSLDFNVTFDALWAPAQRGADQPLAARRPHRRLEPA